MSASTRVGGNTPAPDPAVAALRPLAFSDLAGWSDDRHAEAFAAFHRSAQRMARTPHRTRALGIDGAALARVGAAALDLTAPDDGAARRFFERHFIPHLVEPAQGRPFLTGYFEPEVDGALAPSARFPVPLYRRPPDLVDITDANRPVGFDPSFAFARQTATGLTVYPDRAAIEAGALAGQGLELVYVASHVEAFFIHVQGSARIRLAEGGLLRVAYAGKTGHPYSSIGRILVARGVAPAEQMTADRLRAWLEADEARGRALMQENRSFIFFRPLDGLEDHLGAVAAAGVQITPGRSLAVDRFLHTFGSPIWLETDLPTGPNGAVEPMRRLMIAQDTGSAILGPARGDFFYGLGDEAGRLAGLTRHQPERFVVFVPSGG
jgi:membrane-bound lytic murein transglycosylase A